MPSRTWRLRREGEATSAVVRNRDIIAANIEPPGWLRGGILVQLSAGSRLDFTGLSGCLHRARRNSGENAEKMAGDPGRAAVLIGIVTRGRALPFEGTVLAISRSGLSRPASRRPGP